MTSGLRVRLAEKAAEVRRAALRARLVVLYGLTQDEADWVVAKWGDQWGTR